MGGFTVPPDELRSTADVLKALKDSARDIHTLAGQADPDDSVWGGLGLLFMKDNYQGKADEAREHIGMIGDGLDAMGEAVRVTADNYDALDRTIAESFQAVLGQLTGGGADGDAYVGNDGGGDTYAVDMGPTNLIDYNPTVPVATNLVTGVKGMFDDGVDSGDITAIGSSVMEFGANAVAIAGDPIGWLISAGLGFLIDLFQPLEDALSLVTGNAERMLESVNTWNQVAAALEPLGEGVQEAAESGLIGWQGLDADAAKTRLVEFGEATIATGGEAEKIASLLNLFSALMSAAQQIILNLIAMLIEHFVVLWAAAFAASVPTAGASIASASTVSAVHATQTCSRAVTIIDRVVSIIYRISNVLSRLVPGALKTVMTSSKAISIASGFVPALTTPIIPGIQHGTTDGPDMSSEEISDGLDASQ